MFTDPNLYKSLLVAFNKVEEISWPQLAEKYASPESNVIHKIRLSEALKIIQKNNWVEKIPGLPLKWKITESGRYKAKEIQRQKETNV